MKKKPIRLIIAQTICRYLPPIISQSLRTFIYSFEQACVDDYEFTTQSQTGSDFRSRTSDFHGYPFSVHGFYEWRNCAIAIALCEPGDTIVEIGANIGTETVCFSDTVGSSGTVYAFEPLPINVKALENGLSLCQFQNVKILPYAVGDKCDKVSFVEPPSIYASGMGHILGEEVDEGAKPIEVVCVTLDSIADTLGPAKIIFMDVEGAEILVLRGGRNYIEEHKPCLVLEADRKLLNRAGSNSNELCRELKNLGYEIFHISKLSLSSLEQEKIMRPANWFCVESSRTDIVKNISRVIRLSGILPCIKGWNPICK